ncbi:MAG: glycosyltransferase [Thermoplasmata archaeon]|nr:glycosyltransferase [Thermoplasmata archaeon]
MRIGMFTKTYIPTPDGVAYYVYEAKRALDREHEVYIFTNALSHRGKVRRHGDIIRFPSIPFPPYPIYRIALFPFKKAVKIVKELDLDILHAHTPFMFGAMAFFAKRDTGKPLVSTFHTDFLNMRGTLKGRLVNHMFIDVGWAFSCAMYRRGDAIIAPTMLMKKELEKNDVHVPVHVVWDGIDHRHYSKPPTMDVRKRFKVPRDSPIVLFLSRLTRDKGVYTLLDTAKGVHKKTGAVFIVAGTGPEQESLAAKAKKEKAEGYFRVVGHVSEVEKKALYHAADVFVLPSRAETFGMVLLEAMASHTPVIGAASGGIIEVIQDGQNGLLFPWGNSDELEQRLLMLLDDGNTRKRLVEGGYRLVTGAASIEASVKKTLEIYEGLLRR